MTQYVKIILFPTFFVSQMLLLLNAFVLSQFARCCSKKFYCQSALYASKILNPILKTK